MTNSKGAMPPSDPRRANSGPAAPPAGPPILIVDPVPLFRDLLAAWLQAESPGRTLMLADNLAAGLAAAEQYRPAVTLVHVALASTEIAQAPKAFLRAGSTRVLFLARHLPHSFVQTALKAGVAGLFCMDEPARSLRAALQQVGAGRSYVSAAFSASGPVQHFTSGLAELSARELETLVHTAYGLSQRQIAQKLAVSVKTIDVHRSSLRRKLGLTDRVSLARFAIRHGLIEP